MPLPLRSQLKTTPPPRTAVFLLRRRPFLGVLSILNPFNLGILRSHPLATLEITETSVRCTLGNKYGYAGWLAKRLDIPDLKKRLETEQVTVFEYPRNGYEIRWPKLDKGTLFVIGEPGSAQWITSFSLPPDDYSPHSLDWESLAFFATEIYALRDKGMREIRKMWRQALASEAGAPDSG